MHIRSSLHANTVVQRSTNNMPLKPLYKAKGYGKPLTMEYFTEVITWKSIKKIMYVKDYENFLRFMMGQTVNVDGVYACDLEDFLYNKKNNL